MLAFPNGGTFHVHTKIVSKGRAGSDDRKRRGGVDIHQQETGQIVESPGKPSLIEAVDATDVEFDEVGEE